MKKAKVMNEVNEALGRASIGLSSRQRLERERSAGGFRDLFPRLSPSQLAQLEQFIFDLLSTDCWEARHGGLLLSNVYLKWVSTHASKSASELQFASRLTDRVMAKVLFDKQIALRLSAGETLALLCGINLGLYEQKIQEPLLKAIEDNMYLERDDHADETEEGKKLREKLLAGEAAQQAKLDAALLRSDEPNKGPVAGSVASSSKSSIFHDTAGWKTLETDVKALDHIIRECKSNFAPFMTTDLLELISQCAVHCHRFVRGLTFRIICTLFESVGEPTVSEIAQNSDLVTRLASGLTDQWPEVRMDASIATRAFFTNVKVKEPFYDLMLPRMCINRYFVADGVRAYSQTTWATLFGQQGKDLVAQYCPSFVEFYLAQSQVSNFEMREAVCHCIGELVSKIDAGVVRPYVSSLVAGLLALSAGSTWPVRIASDAALSKCIELFPEECRSYIEQIQSSLFHQVADRTWSVREQAAITLGVLAKMFQPECMQPILQFALQGVPAAKQEEDDSKKYHADSPDGIKQLHDNDVKLHTNQNMFDCCSAGALPEEEAHHHHHCWELSDGCFYLVRELSASFPTQVEPALSQMVTAVGYKHYLRHTQLQETLCKVLPTIAKNLGKRAFKQHLEIFFDVLADCVSRSADRRVQVQASTCIKELITFVGPLIFQGRLKQYNPDLLESFSRSFPELRDE